MHRPKWLKSRDKGGSKKPVDPGIGSSSSQAHVALGSQQGAETYGASTASTRAASHEASRQPCDDPLKSTLSNPASDGCSLWALAHEDVQRADPELIREFEGYLGMETVGNGLDADNLAQRALQEIDKAEDSRSKLHDVSVTIRKHFEQALKIVVASKDFITAIASTNPYAALAWTGISFVLPLVLSPTEENEAAITGLHYIANLMLVYRWKEKTHLRDVDELASSDFKSQTRPLYAKILEYEARLVVHKHNASLKRFASDLFQHGRWTDYVKQIQDLHAKCTNVTDAIAVVQAQAQMNKTQEWQDKLLQQPRQEKEHENIKSLYSNYKAAKDLNPGRVPRTCEWFLYHTNFLTWRETQSSSLLWLSADPGCGKSVLSKYLVDRQVELLTINHEPPTVCYFFFKDTDATRKDSAQAIRAFLHQLIMQQPHLYQLAEKDFDSKSNEFLSDFGSLWTIFLDFVANSTSREITCILDALDECDAVSRKALAVKLVEHFGSGATRTTDKPILKFIVTSRPEIGIESDLYELTRLSSEVRLRGEEESEQISREINLVIRHKFSEPGPFRDRLSERNRSALLENLLGMKNRTYLWLHLTFHAIEKKIGFNKHDIANISSTIPRDVEAAYTAILDKSEDRERARKLLHIVLGAVRPLTLQEINVAMNIEEGCESYKDLDLWPPEQCETIIKNTCGLFLSVRRSEVYLIHQTAKDFLVKDANKPAQPSSQGSSRSEWQQSFDLEQSHLHLARICVWFLQLQEFEEDHLEFVYRHKLDWEVKLKKYDETVYFSPNRRWKPNDGWHDMRLRRRIISEPGTVDRITIITEADGSEGFNGDSRPESGYELGYDWLEDVPNIYSLTKLEQRLSFFPVREALEQRYWYLSYAIQSWYLHVTEAVSLLDLLFFIVLTDKFLTASFRPLMCAYMSPWLDKFVSRRLSSGHTTLHIASLFGNCLIVKALLSQMKTDPNPRNNPGETPLHYAIKQEHTEVVRLLLDNGADPHCRDSSSMTILGRAVKSRNVAMVRLLLDKGAKAESTNYSGKTALHLGAELSEQAIVEALLEKTTEVDLKDSYGETPLFYAVGRGSEKVVDLLLRAGAEANSRCSNGETLLFSAVGHGSEKVVDLLLRAGAEANSRCSNGETPLFCLTWNSINCFTIAKLLLESGAETNATNTDGETPLFDIAGTLPSRFVKLLLDHGAEVNTMSTNGETPLLRAVRGGHERTVGLLLENGARIDLSEKNRNRFEIAVDFTNAMVLKTLLKNGYDADIPDEAGQTPLFGAAMVGDDDQVEILLEHGVRADLEDGCGRTPLSYSAEKGSSLAVKLLIQRGVRTDLEDKAGWTPFSYATQLRDTEIATLLLAHDVRTDLKNDSGGTPLSHAAAEGSFVIVKLLLERGVRADLDDNFGRTPLSYAAAYGDEMVVQLLLKHAVRTDLEDMHGRTPLSYAANGTTKGSFAIAKLLLEHGVRTDLEDNHGRTPLFYAPIKRDELVVKLLLKNGVRTDSKDNNNRTPWDYANSAGEDEIVRLLEEHSRKERLSGSPPAPTNSPGRCS